MQQVQVDMREVQAKKKEKFFHHENSKGTGWPHIWLCFEQKVGLETSGVPLRLNYLQSWVHSIHLTETTPLLPDLCDGPTLWRPEGFWLSPDSPGPPWEMIARRYGTRNFHQHFVGNLQLQSTLVHPQGSTFKAADFHDTSRKMCTFNIHGLNYVLEVPSFLLNKSKKVKNCFRENQPPLTGYLKHQTQLVAKGNSVLGVLDLNSQAVSTTSLRQCLHQAEMPFQAGG